MSLKCKIFGHDYELTETRLVTEQRRDSETKRQHSLQKCMRCGFEKLLSNNLASIGCEGQYKKIVTDGAGTEYNSDGDDAVIIDGTEDVDDSEEVEEETMEDSEPESTEKRVASGDEGVVIFESRDSQNHSAAEEETESEEKGQDPGVSGKTGVGGSAVRNEMDDAVFIESGPSDSGEEDSGNSENPSSDMDSDSPSVSGDAELIDNSPEKDGRPETGLGSADKTEGVEESVDTSSAQSADAEDLEEVYCTECGYRNAFSTESRREGDACPECHQNFLKLE